MVASGCRMIGSVVIMPPAVFSSYVSSRRSGAASCGRISCSRRSLPSSGSSESRSAASSGSMASSTSAARSSRSLPRISTWSSSGSSSSTSASRSSCRAAATSIRRLADRWCSTFARSAGRSCSKVASRFAAPWPDSSTANPVTADHSTVSASPRRRSGPPRPLRTNTLSICQSLRAGSCTSPTSSTVTVSPDSTRVTLRSSSSPRTSVSAGRCSKRRMLSTPVVTTWPDSTPVTRVMGRKMRRRLTTSTTSPSTPGGRPPIRSSVTTSRTRPTRSPFGSKTATPDRCETKTREEPAAIPAHLPRPTGAAPVRFRLTRPLRPPRTDADSAGRGGWAVGTGRVPSSPTDRRRYLT